MSSNITLLAENYLLKKKLEIAQNWMKREISGQVKNIAHQKNKSLTQREKSGFLSDNVEEIVSKEIQSFFGEVMLMSIPSGIIENIISAEITYYNFRHNPQADGFAVISSYHKALDIIIEEFITKEFRNFITIAKLPKTVENNSLEKALYSVIHNNYNLSAGRLFHIIQTLREYFSGEQKTNRLPTYTYLFYKFIKKYFFIKNTLLEDDHFFKLFTDIIESEVLGNKRHNGRISFVETRLARKILIGEFREKDCLIYKLILLGEI